jgi:hypothetical protein
LVLLVAFLERENGKLRGALSFLVYGWMDGWAAGWMDGWVHGGRRFLFLLKLSDLGRPDNFSRGLDVM